MTLVSVWGSCVDDGIICRARKFHESCRLRVEEDGKFPFGSLALKDFRDT